MDKDELLQTYGIYTFNKKRMKELLPNEVFEDYIYSLESGEEVSKKNIKIISEKMKEWALSMGATHYTHWFSSLNGMSAEKHDAFIEPSGQNVYYKFNEDTLLRGESDASSFPNGGLRSTFKARGYTVWDKSSISFIKDGTLYIPSLFYSYTGEALDYKTHLLKSSKVLNKNLIKLLDLLDVQVDRVDSYVGVEQEYFLISKELYHKRLDLVLTGRTLFGKIGIKEQEEVEHYFSPVKEKVKDFMRKLDVELWKYGIPSKTKHNEAAPNQFEVVSVYRKVNTSADHNMLLMNIINEIAEKEGLVCLLHEKPFKGINGSGKHNNWSLITNTNVNLFSPGSNPIDNIPFMCLLSCLVKGLDEYGELLGLSISSYSNEHRLGGNEAPPKIISMCLGEGINDAINCILNKEKNGKYVYKKDELERNRTSPFAFVGNRFEFRGVGSSQSVAFINTILNSILSFEISEFVKELEKGEQPVEIIKKYLKNHRRVIYEGDGYSSNWKEEAKRRGLKEFSFSSSIELLKNKDAMKILLDQEIYSQPEIDSLYQILIDKYCKEIKVEAKTFIYMIEKEIYSPVLDFLNNKIDVYKKIRSINCENEGILNEIKEINSCLEKMMKEVNALKISIKEFQMIKENKLQIIKKYKNQVISTMDKLREIVDNIEESIDKNNWPLPTYIDLLFSL